MAYSGGGKVVIPPPVALMGYTPSVQSYLCNPYVKSNMTVRSLSAFHSWERLIFFIAEIFYCGHNSVNSKEEKIRIGERDWRDTFDTHM